MPLFSRNSSKSPSTADSYASVRTAHALRFSALSYDYHNNNLPNLFHSFFTKASSVHSYNTRLASKSSYSIPYARTNYGKFNIRFTGAKVWNSVDEELKNLSKESFKKKT